MNTGQSSPVTVPFLNTRIERTLPTGQKKWSRAIYIYLAFDPGGNLFKIGRTEQPEVRLATLRSQFQSEIRFITVWYSFFFEEQELHTTFKERRVRGEWFSLTNDDLTTLHKLVSKYTIKYGGIL